MRVDESIGELSAVQGSCQVPQSYRRGEIKAKGSSFYYYDAFENEKVRRNRKVALTETYRKRLKFYHERIYRLNKDKEP